MKANVLVVFLIAFLSSCIGETTEENYVKCKVKNMLQDTVNVSLSLDNTNSNEVFCIVPETCLTLYGFGYLSDENGCDIKNANTNDGCRYMLNKIRCNHLIINTLSGDTLADFAPNSSIYNIENWQLEKLDNYDIECTLIITEELIKSSKP